MASWDENVAAIWKATPSQLQFIFLVSFFVCSWVSGNLILERRFWCGWLEIVSSVYYYVFGALATPFLCIFAIILAIFFIHNFIVGLGRQCVLGELESCQTALSSEKQKATRLSEELECLKLDHEYQSRKHEKVIAEQKASSESQQCAAQATLLRTNEDLDEVKKLLCRKRDDYFTLKKYVTTLDIEKANIVKKTEQELARREEEFLAKYRKQKHDFQAQVRKLCADQDVVSLAYKTEAELAKSEMNKKDGEVTVLHRQIEELKKAYEEEKQKLEDCLAAKIDSTVSTITTFQEIPDNVKQMVIAEHERLLATALETQRSEFQKEWEENKPGPVTVEIIKTITTLEEIPDSVKEMVSEMYDRAMEAERIEQRRMIEDLKKGHENDIEAMKALYNEELKKTDLNIRTQVQAENREKGLNHETQNQQLKTINTELVGKYETLQAEVKTLSKEVTEKSKAIEGLQLAVRYKDETIQDQIMAVRQLAALRKQPEEPKTELMEVEQAPKPCHACIQAKFVHQMLTADLQRANQELVRVKAAQQELVAVCKEGTIWEEDPAGKLSDLDRVLDSYKEMFVVARDAAQMREDQELDYDDTLVVGVARLVKGLRQQIEYLEEKDKESRKKMMTAVSRTMTLQAEHDALFKDRATAKGDLQGIRDILIKKGALTPMMNDPVAVFRKIVAEHGDLKESQQVMTIQTRKYKSEMASKDAEIKAMKQRLSGAEAMA